MPHLMLDGRVLKVHRRTATGVHSNPEMLSCDIKTSARTDNCGLYNCIKRAGRPSKSNNKKPV